MGCRAWGSAVSFPPQSHPAEEKNLTVTPHRAAVTTARAEASQGLVQEHRAQLCIAQLGLMGQSHVSPGPGHREHYRGAQR